MGASQQLKSEHEPLLTRIVPYDFSANLASARARDPVEFDQGLAEGKTWSLNQAVAAGLAACGC